MDKRKLIIIIAFCLALIVVMAGMLSGNLIAQSAWPLQDIKTHLWADDLPPILPSSLAYLRSAGPETQTEELQPLSVTGLADWSRIAFQSYRDGNWEIYLARGDGSQPVRLTAHSASDVRPRLNRGATRLAFASNRDGNYEIYSMNTDGSGLARLTINTSSDTSPVWSPDSTRLAFASNRDGNNEIFKMNADGSGQARCTFDAADDIAPAWSPDGSHIAWVRRGSSGNALWVMDADCANLHSLTGPLTYLQNPAWSPDSTRLAFDGDTDGDDWNELAVVNADGTGLHTIYDTYAYLVDAWMGSWSPDGNWLLFSRVEYVVYQGQLYLGNTYIEQVQTTGGGSERLIASGYDLSPDWRTADVASPQSRVKPLAKYSRATAVPVQWSGSDIGPAGIASYDVQYRVGAPGAWTDWLQNTTSTSSAYSGTPGTIVYFRSRARDNAGNVEAWLGADGDSSTTLYLWQLSGRATDNREIPLANVPITVTPSPVNSVRTGPYGSYTVHLAAQGTLTVEASHKGYGGILASPFDVASDSSFGFYLPPSDNVVKNGSFEADESQLADWVVSGTLPVSLTTAVRHTGARALTAGLTCSSPCLSDAITLWTGESPEIAADSLGNLHMVWGQGDGLYHTTRTPNGIWTEPETISGLSGLHPVLAIDRHDTLHVILNGLYTQRTPLGSWTAPISVAPSEDVDIAADSRGGVHVVYRGGQIYYLERLPSGIWQVPIPLDAGGGYMGPGIAVGPDDSVHFVWQEVGGAVYHRGRLPDGTWTSLTKLFEDFGYASGRQRITVGPNGDLHAFWPWGYAGYYASQLPGGSWSVPTTLSKARGNTDLAVDSQGIVHMVSKSSIASEEGTYYRRKTPSGQWSEPVGLSGDYWSIPSIVVDRADLVHFVWDDFTAMRYVTTRRSVKTGTVFLSQVITVPADLYQPTLSFMYNLHGALPLTDEVGFEVSVSTSVTATQVFSTPMSVPWSLVWIDMRPWAGKVVTVSFVIRQAMGDPYIHLLLDDISLGSWRTPVISAVSPPQVEAWTVTPITITGDNFVATLTGSLYLEGPVVRLNDVALPDTRWVSTTTLTATIPITMSPSRYDVWVTNPGGQEAVLPGALVVGKLAYLPLVLKEYMP